MKTILITSRHVFLLGILGTGLFANVLFVLILFANPNAEYLGLYQRIVGLTFVAWIVICVFTIKSKNQ